MKRVSIIVPCYNEENALPLFCKELNQIVRNCREKYDFQVILVNDGSKDGTLQVCRRMSQIYTYISYLSFGRNYGKEAAMYAGLRNAKGDYVGIMDADLQDPPSILPQMIEILETSEYYNVATRRINRKGEPIIRSFLAKVFYKIINKISDCNFVDGERDYRLMKREMVDTIVLMREYNRFSKGLFGYTGFKTYWIEYENVERIAGKTTWSFWRLCRYAIDGITDFSEVPLTMASWLGIIMTVIALFALVFVIVRKLIFGDPVDGWASLVSIIIFLGGIQLLCLGIVGKYIAKIYMETKNRPHYIITETDMINVSDDLSVENKLIDENKA